MSTKSTSDPVTRFARWIGDLDHPFYDDERNRWVWYEASAMGFQLALIGSYLAGAVVIFAKGSDMVPWVLVMMLPAMAGSILAMGHVERHAATYAPSLFDVRRSRGALVIVALAAFVAAVVVTGLSDDSLTAIGLGVAAGFGAVAGVVGQRRQQRMVADEANARDGDLD